MFDAELLDPFISDPPEHSTIQKNKWRLRWIIKLLNHSVLEVQVYQKFQQFKEPIDVDVELWHS